MSPEAIARNPFMLMLEPEVVLAAIERSEKLGRLNRRMCHPLDKPIAPAVAAEETVQRPRWADSTLN
jgi:hypothetical protein